MAYLKNVRCCCGSEKLYTENWFNNHKKSKQHQNWENEKRKENEEQDEERDWIEKQAIAQNLYDSEDKKLSGL